MRVLNDIYEQDLKNILENKEIDWNMFQGRRILVTGATGLIGSTLVNALLYLNSHSDIKCEVLAYVRDMKKAEKSFISDVNNPEIVILTGDICERISVSGDVDYIFHCASQTSSKGFVQDPVGTIQTALDGTKNLLELAKEKGCKGFLYLSSMEVYGTPDTDEKITEARELHMRSDIIRNCYPLSKCMCENMCVSYMNEYGIPTKIVRLTQTFGPGVAYSDQRVFAEFARCTIEGKNIILHTLGETKRNYLYTADAVGALFLIMLRGKEGEIYNAANEDTYISIYDMACLVADKISAGKIEVVKELGSDPDKFGYAPVLHMNLSSEKLQRLGWKPKYGLEAMFSRMISTMV